MNQHSTEHDPQDEQDLDVLLREVGAREQPAASMASEVRAAVEAEWRKVVARKRMRQWQYVGVAAAASLLIAVFGWRAWLSSQPSNGAVVARVVRASGSAQLMASNRVMTISPQSAGVSVHEEERLRTGPGARLAVQITPELTVRIDERSQIKIADAGHIVLQAGAVYIDATPGSASNHALIIETPFGSVQHVGTEYESRIVGDSLRVSVREGEVSMHVAQVVARASAGEQLQISSQNIVRRRIPLTGESWRWVEEVTPPFDIENRSLAEFLRWASRETGREVAYSSDKAEESAKEVMLHGSIAGLSPEAAVNAVLSTTRFTYSATENRIILDLRP